MEKRYEKMIHALTWLFAIYWCYTLLSVLLLSQENAYKLKGFHYSNFMPLLGILLLWIIAKRVSKKRIFFVEPLSEKRFYQILIGVCLGAFALQIICGLFIAKPLQFDFQSIQEEAISTGLYHRFDNMIYFNRFQNNFGILFVFSLLMRIFRNWNVVIGVGLILVDISIYMSAQISYKLTKSKRTALQVLILGIILFGFSYRAFVPYTDNYAVFFYLLPIFLYMNGKHGKGWIAVSAVSMAVSCYLKMTAFIILIAAILIAFLYKQENRKEFWKKVLIFFFTFLLAYIAAGKGSKLYFEETGFVEEKDQEIGFWHYFMLGQNDRTLGTYNKSDVKFSLNYPTKEERSKENRKEGIRRIKERGIKGNLLFYTYKNYQNYFDGCFVANQKTVKGEAFGDSFIEKIFIQKKAYYQYYALIEQMIWIWILILIAISAFRSKGLDYQTFFYLAIMGVSAYTLIFESRSKYLYMFLPLYLIVAADGIGGKGEGKGVLKNDKVHRENSSANRL